ncbi:MAG: D-lyxose/D-mannose family sugar isomerase [Verrucomicrobiae bacterium]|nr:D-lyxose/D-mannose family sugar isomerase [Verrucomicrobiae bacterium]
MITKSQYEKARREMLRGLKRAGIVTTAKEAGRIEVADFGLSRFAEIGLGVLTYVNTKRCCAKELALLPWQICPEHRHPKVGGEPGKEETFRCRQGVVFLYVPGPKARRPHGRAPADRKPFFTVWHEVVLKPGEQYTLQPNTLHWFQAGSRGAIVSEFSTRSRDEADIFTDPDIARCTKIR